MKYTKEICIALLKGKSAALASEGMQRYPQRSDFTEAEVEAVKAFLGPWPRALEAAGLKPARTDTRARRTTEARIRAKRRRNAAESGGTGGTA